MRSSNPRWSRRSRPPAPVSSRRASIDPTTAACCVPCEGNTMPTTTTTEGLIIDGQRVNASDGHTFDVYDPSSGEVLASVAKATKADVARAVQSARAALDSKAWGGILPAERGRILFRMAQAIRDRAEELATLESHDKGKPLRQSCTDVQVAERYLEYFGGIAHQI